MKISYENHVLPYKYNFKKIELSPEKVQKAKKLAEKIAIEKQKETHHRTDNRSAIKRNMTGILGEMAIEQYLGMTGIVDWTVGDSKKYHRPDLENIGLPVGVKTVRYGSFPLVFKEPRESEIIVIMMSKTHFVLCGVGRPETLRAYQSDELVNDQRILQRGTKTGFYGFGALIQFEDYKELERIVKQRSLN